jgi:UPF0755 protein
MGPEARTYRGRGAVPGAAPDPAGWGDPAGRPGPLPPRRDPRTDPGLPRYTDSEEVPAFAGPAAGAPTAFTMPDDRRRPWPDDDEHTYDDEFGDDTYYDDYDDEVEDDLPTRRGCRNVLVVLAVLLVCAMVAGWFAWSWAQGQIDPSGEPGERVVVEIPEGTSTAGIGDVLADAGVIANATVWDWYTKLREVGSIQAGTYEMRLNSSFTEALDDLSEDPLPPNASLLTVPEGLTQAQVAARLVDPDDGVAGFTAEAVQAALADPAARSAFLPADQTLLEGTLFPETYTVEEGDTPSVVIRRMVAHFDEVMADIGATDRATALGITPYEAVIVASMVERESGTEADMPKVARVIYNRLADDEALGIDATSCYEKGEIPCELTTADLESDSPYNTRNTPGLPPTPIASPGQASLEAALAPAEGDWKWYVLDADKDDGSSIFTNSYEDFQAAKARCVEAGLGCG